MGKRLNRYSSNVGNFCFTLISNPAHIITVIFNGMLSGLVTAENWLDEDSQYKGRKAQKASNFFRAALNWLIIKRLKVTMKLVCFLWSKTGGALGKTIIHFQTLARGKDPGGARRSKAKKIWYGVLSVFLSVFSLAVVLFPVFTVVLRFKPFVVVIDWFHKIGKSISSRINSYFSGRDTDDVLVTANVYSIKKIGQVFIYFAVELCCLVAAGFAALCILGFQKIFGKKTEKEERSPEDKVDIDDAQKRNRLVERFDAEIAHLKSEWSGGKKGTVILRIILNPAAIIGFVIAGVNKALVVAIKKCSSSGVGRFINLLFLERLQLLVQLIHYTWNFLGGGLSTTLDNCISRMTDSKQKLSKRILAGLSVFGLSALSWLMVVEPYVGVLVGLAKALPCIKVMVKFGHWLHGGLSNAPVFRRLNNVMSWSGLYPIRLLGRLIAATAIYVWAFAVLTPVFKMLNICFGFKRKGPDVGVKAIFDDAASLSGSLTPTVPGAGGAENMVADTMEAEASGEKSKFKKGAQVVIIANQISRKPRTFVDLSEAAPGGKETDANDVLGQPGMDLTGTQPGNFSTSTVMAGGKPAPVDVCRVAPDGHFVSSG